MVVPVRRQESDRDGEHEEPTAVVTSHQTRPGKLVFTERNNTEGWLASDLTVDLEP